MAVKGEIITPSPRRGEGWGEGARSSRKLTGIRHPHPTSVAAGRSPGPLQDQPHSLQGGGLLVRRDVQLSLDSLQDASEVFDHVIVPKTNDPVAVRLDHPRTSGIRLNRQAMLPAIQLDYQLGAPASEVRDGVADRELPEEFETIELASSQTRPKQCFRIGGTRPKRAGVGSHPSHSHRRPNSTPSPRRGEGWGEGARYSKSPFITRHPHPTLSLKGEGFRTVA